MHPSRRMFTAFTSALILVLPAALQAQDQVVTRSTGGIGTGAVIVEQGPIVAGFGESPTGPYTMTIKTTRVQKLANGVTITHENITKRAVDSYGRSYNEDHLPAPANLVVMSIVDPVNHTHMNWNSNSKTVMVVHVPDPATLQHVAPQQQQPPIPIHANVNPAPAPKPQIEDLGTQTILGVTAEGRRITRTIPAGQDGNDQAFTVTTEDWYSSDLRMNLLSIRDDPRTGTTTREVTEFQRGEPDPSLFQIPAGYAIQELNPQN
jgi:hypothetical protein